MKKFHSRFLALAAFVALFPLSARAQASAEVPKLDLSKFTLVWHDEFDGNKLDTTKWQAPEMPRQGACRWNASLVSVHDGALHLGIRLTDDPTYRYDCGAVRTQKDYDSNQTMYQQKYGYFEARIKLPQNINANYWGSFWMMCGKVSSDTPDTRDGLEVDIMESFHLATKQGMEVAFHWNGYGARHNHGGFSCGATPQLRDNQFHRYGMYWDDKVYVNFIDGMEVGRTNLMGLGSDKGGKTKSNGPCQQPGYLKLTCEAAPWAGATGIWLQNPPREDEMLVNYIRAYAGTLPAPAAKDDAEKK